MNPAPRSAHELLLQQLALYLREAEEILNAWDDYTEYVVDNESWPLDETSYGFRQARRDGDTWRSYSRIRLSAKDLTATAVAQLRALPKDSTNSRWAWQIASLHTAAGEISSLQSDWLDFRATLPGSARPGVEEYDGPLAERNAEAWHYLNEWSRHGHAVLDIHSAVQLIRPRPTAPTLALPSPRSTAGPRR
ncbi:hypothetical protein ACIQZO_19175 [Streptomyces sp. NPDC097617]|uniref:hypothetical protein n=1 Tax=Streptomyces sp. NPDC097617 TaxID=3366091 RepID=UPI00380F491B